MLLSVFPIGARGIDSKLRPVNPNRRLVFIALGEYPPRAERPIWFSESKLLMDNDGVGIGLKNQMDIGGYMSFASRGNNKRIMASRA